MFVMDRSYGLGICDFLRRAKRYALPRPVKARVEGYGTVTISMLQLTSMLWQPVAMPATNGGNDLKNYNPILWL